MRIASPAKWKQLGRVRLLLGLRDKAEHGFGGTWERGESEVLTPCQISWVKCPTSRFLTNRHVNPENCAWKISSQRFGPQWCSLCLIWLYSNRITLETSIICSAVCLPGELWKWISEIAIACCRTLCRHCSLKPVAFCICGINMIWFGPRWSHQDLVHSLLPK